jgi:hypothetical protein
MHVAGDVPSQWQLWQLGLGAGREKVFHLEQDTGGKERGLRI